MPAHPAAQAAIRATLAFGALASTLTPLAALAQATPPVDPRVGSYNAPTSYQGNGPAPDSPQGAYQPDGYRDQPGYPDQRDDPRDGYAQPGYYPNGAPMPEPPPPPGYDGRSLPPPPPGYVASPEDRRDADERYAANAERWARENCVKSGNNAGTGALVGGILGAIIGSSVAGRHDRGAGAFAGAAIGAVGGAAVGSQSGGETSPGCPPGYSVRRDAVTYTYVEPDYVYAAPGWYRPWVYSGDAWVYRPYPYHGWYSRTYRVRSWGDHGGYYRGEGWRRHGWGRRGW